MQLVREHKRFGMASVHQRVDTQRPVDVKHPRHHKGCRALAFVVVPKAPRARNGSDLQPGHQGSKNCCKVSQSLFYHFGQCSSARWSLLDTSTCTCRCLTHFLSKLACSLRQGLWFHNNTSVHHKNLCRHRNWQEILSHCPLCSFRNSITRNRCGNFCPKVHCRRFVLKSFGENASNTTYDLCSRDFWINRKHVLHPVRSSMTSQSRSRWPSCSSWTRSRRRSIFSEHWRRCRSSYT